VQHRSSQQHRSHFFDKRLQLHAASATHCATHVIRNAGGRASDDAIRSLVISYKLLGTKEWFVIHHTDCGMQLFADDVLADLLKHSLETATITHEGWKDVGVGPGSSAGKFIKWHTISNLEQSVIDDVARIRSHALVPRNIPIYGYLYDVKTGRLIEVENATIAGRSAGWRELDDG
jgi:carbonic anhydrase